MRYGGCGSLVLTLLVLSFGGAALAKDDDDEGDTAPQQPSVYLDLRSYYSSVPAGVLSVGFGDNIGLTLSSLSRFTSVPGSLSLPASRGAGLDIPLTVDVNDRLSLYGGFSATSSQFGGGSWSDVELTSFSAGFQADVYRQNGGSLPTITVQSTLTRALSGSPLATTSLNTVTEAGYALDADETRGLLAGFQVTTIGIDADIVKAKPALLGYVGGYYQWDNNWKFTGRAGVQWFGGIDLLQRTPVDGFTGPTVRLDIDKMDDNDNRLFGVTAQIAWTPQPTYQLILRTPLHLRRN